MNNEIAPFISEQLDQKWQVNCYQGAPGFYTDRYHQLVAEIDYVNQICLPNAAIGASLHNYVEEDFKEATHVTEISDANSDLVGYQIYRFGEHIFEGSTLTVLDSNISAVLPAARGSNLTARTRSFVIAELSPGVVTSSTSNPSVLSLYTRVARENNYLIIPDENIGDLGITTRIADLAHSLLARTDKGADNFDAVNFVRRNYLPIQPQGVNLFESSDFFRSKLNFGPNDGLFILMLKN